MNRQKNEKPSPKEMRGSLSLRILFIAIVFLIIPLLFLSSILYFEDSRIKKKDNLFTLSILSKSEKGRIEEIIQNGTNVLDLMNFFLSSHFTEMDMNKIFSNISYKEGIGAIFHLNSLLVCDAASDPKFIGKNFSNKEKFDKDQKNFPYLYLFTNGFGIALTTEYFMKTVDYQLGEKTKVNVFLLSANQEIIISSDPRFLHQKFEGVKDNKESHLRVEDETYLGILTAIPAIDGFIFICIPEAFNFVDIPYFLYKMIGLLSLILIIGGGITYWLTRRLAKPLNHLCLVMNGVKRGDLSSHYRMDRMGFEINMVGGIFNEMIASIVAHMKEIKAEKIEKEILKQEFKIGQEVQKSILPKELPDFPGLTIGARFISAKEVGGDFYDFLMQESVPNNRLMISIADTAGKGIYACLYSLSVRSMLRSYAECYDDLSEIIKKTNNLFCHDTGDSGVFVTAFVGFFDHETKEFHFSNCGHHPSVLRRKNGTIEKLTTKGIALGVVPFHQVMTSKVQLESGDMLLLFTDGIVEAHNEKMKMFGEEKLISHFEAKSGLQPQQIVDEIIEEVALFADGAPQYDDLTILILKVD